MSQDDSQSKYHLYKVTESFGREQYIIALDEEGVKNNKRYDPEKTIKVEDITSLVPISLSLVRGDLIKNFVYPTEAWTIITSVIMQLLEESYLNVVK